MAVFHNQGKSSASKEAAGAYNGPVSVGRFVTPIAGKTLSRGGAVLTELICEWPAIAGPALALYTRPEKLTRAGTEFRGKVRAFGASLEGRSGKGARSPIQHAPAYRTHQPNAGLQSRVRLARRAGSGSQKGAKANGRGKACAFEK